MANFSNVADFASLDLTPNLTSVPAGGSFKLTVSVDMSSDSNKLNLNVEYKLFVRLSGDLQKKSVLDVDKDTSDVAPFSTDWTGVAPVTQWGTNNWDSGSSTDTAVLAAYKNCLLATWSTTSIDRTKKTMDYVLEWTIDIDVASAAQTSAKYEGRLFAVETTSTGKDPKSMLSKEDDISITATTQPQVLAEAGVEVESDKGNLAVYGSVTDKAKVKEIDFYWDSISPNAEVLKLQPDEEDNEFYSVLAISDFHGKLSPKIVAITPASGSETKSLLFVNASGLLEIQVNITPDGQSASSVADKHALIVSAGKVGFTIKVNSKVGLEQPLDMYVILGEAFSGALVSTVSPPTSGLGKVTQAAGWNGTGATAKILQCESVAQGASFSITGSATLAHWTSQELQTHQQSHPGITTISAESISVAFVEPQSPQRILGAANSQAGVIFTAQLKEK